MQKLLAALLALFISAAVVVGCGQGAVEQKDVVTRTSVSGIQRQGDFSVSLSVEPRKSEAGRGFSLTLSVRNLSDKQRKFDFQNAQMFDFFAYPKQGQEVWRWSSGTYFAQMLSSETIESGQSKVYKAEWDAAGQTPGTYSLEGVFLGLPNLRPMVDVEVLPRE